MAKRISVINFKGGVGKTSLVLHLGTGLSYYHESKVLLIDVDHQSSLSTTILKKKWDYLKDNQTVNAIFEYFSSGGSSSPPKDDIIIKAPYGTEYPDLDLVPSTLKLDETEIDLGSTTIGKPVVSEWKKRSLICKWLSENNIDKDYDYIIFDCPPATKLVTQNAIVASHGVIIPFIPDAVSTRGIPHLLKKVLKKIDVDVQNNAETVQKMGIKIEDTYVPKTKNVGLVMYMIQTHGPAYSGYTIDHNANRLYMESKYPKKIIKPYIERGVGVPECLRDGYPVYDYPTRPTIKNRGFIKMFRQLTKEIKKRIDTL